MGKLFRDTLNEGSLVATTDGSGNVTGTNELSPYGEVLSSNTNDSFSYAGLTQDTEYGGDAATYRNYTTEQLRWTRPDPYDGSYDMSNPQSFNRYVYAMNNPLNNIDPSGLQDENGNSFPFGSPFLPADATWGTSYSVDNFQVSNNLANSLMFSGTLQSRMTWSYTFTVPQPYMLVNEVYEIDYDFDLMRMQSAWTIGTGAGAATAPNNTAHTAVAGSVAIPISPGVVADIPFAWIPSTKDVCLGIGGGTGSPGVNVGAVHSSANIEKVLSGASISVAAQSGFVGGQTIHNMNGIAVGNSMGSPGASVTVTYSWCF